MPIEPPRGGRIRYSQLAAVALNVSDLERAARFYEAIVGLQRLASSTAGCVRLLAGRAGQALALRLGREPGLHSLSWALQDEADLDRAAAALSAHGVAWYRLPAGGLRFADPVTGIHCEFVVAALRRTAFRSSVAAIRRLGHVVLRTPRHAESVRFFVEVLGFVVSDSIGERITFLRCPPNPFHHSLAIASGERAGLHHVNFMVSRIDDIGCALNRFRQHNVAVVFGPGRHMPSKSIFLYFLDPDGMTLEYSVGTERFPEHRARPPRCLPLTPSSLDLWGGQPDVRMGATGAIEKLSPDA